MHSADKDKLINMIRPTGEQFAKIRYAGFLIFAVCVFAVYVRAQDYRTVRDGIEYAELTRDVAGQPVRMNLLRLDLRKVRLDVVHAMDAAIGTETTSSIAARHNAIAAINSGFFRLDTSAFAGEAVGTLMIDGELLSESSRNRIALKIVNRKKLTEVSLERSVVNPWFGFGDLHFQVKLSGVDREAKDGESVLFGPEFGKTTLTAAKGTDVILTKCARVVRKDVFHIDCRNAVVADEAANSAIPRDGYVVALGKADSKEKKMLLYELKLYQAGKPGQRRYTVRFENASGMLPRVDEDAVAGVPQLISGGKVDVTWELEKTSKSFVETRHPRTAVAKLKDGKFLMITVDGRSESSGGIGLYDLANLLLEFGATDAMNLDGGGSTTMFLDGRVVNHPSDKEGERRVSDAIVVTLRYKTAK